MKLSLFSQNILIKEYDLQPGQEYIVGRGLSCDITLDEKNGVSRKHLKIVANKENSLEVTLLSKLGELKFDGQLVEEIIIPFNNEFFVKQFKFLFYDSKKDQKNLNSEKQPPEQLTSHDQSQDHPFVDKDSLPSSPTEKTNKIDLPFADKTDPVAPASLSLTEDLGLATTTDQINNDSPPEDTVTAINALAATLHIISSKSGRNKKSYELEGSSWLIGRDKKCSLFLNYPFISRRHFEISRANDGYYIYDYGSANGTRLNDKKLPPEEHIRIYNDDTIAIKSLLMKIEIRDEKFNQKIEHLQELSQPKIDFSDFSSPEPIATKQHKNKKLLFIRATIVLVALMGLYFYSQKGKNKNRQIASSSKKSLNKANGLSKEKQLLASDIYNMAQSFYTQKEHLACLDEIERLHKLTPEFKNSKRIESLCQQGLEIEQEQKIKQEREQQAQQIEIKSNQIADQCQKRFSLFKTKSDLDSCLNQLLVLNPSHPLITDLQNRWEQQELENKLMVEQQINKQKKAAQAERLFAKAQNSKAKGQLKKAITFYNQYLNSSAGITKRKQVAQREVASLQAALTKISTELVKNCKQNFANKNYKDSFYACVEVLKKFPANQEAEEIRISSLKKLRAKAKALYSDGALEESLGNISAAKEKWNEIIETHIKSDEYYRKAKRKLQKYENI